MISPPLAEELKRRIAAAVTKREAAVDVMKELQRHYGWLTDEAVEEAARLLDLSPLQVEELATFYEMIYRQPVGKQVIHVCDSISCWAMGGETMMAHLAGLLGISPGETTADGRFTLLPCACLGNCGNGPAMMIDEKIYGKLTPSVLEGIVGIAKG
ncbi:NADH-quinone oxidoreductase subunit NuoE [Geotalea sp. SG265]|uniref:NADH-quinone oxidoreductase subunit NuoE n=1 Tax=Geotalea sp. SG265 TaxID=2922867 RepID=UPI001FB00302|nr:NADH-quinone oxidoreductase subunit NuoE [Geotalea sp. SG265]